MCGGFIAKGQEYLIYEDDEGIYNNICLDCYALDDDLKEDNCRIDDVLQMDIIAERTLSKNEIGRYYIKKQEMEERNLSPDDYNITLTDFINDECR